MYTAVLLCVHLWQYKTKKKYWTRYRIRYQYDMLCSDIVVCVNRAFDFSCMCFCVNHALDFSLISCNKLEFLDPTGLTKNCAIGPDSAVGNCLAGISWFM